MAVALMDVDDGHVVERWVFEIQVKKPSSRSDLLYQSIISFAYILMGYQ